MVSEIYAYLYWCILFGAAPCRAESLEAYLRMTDYGRKEKKRKEDQ